MCEEGVEVPGCSRGTRRWALKAIGAMALGLALPRRAHARVVAVSLERLSALKKVGGSVAVKLAGHPVLLVRDGAASLRAFNPTCTHKKCNVRYLADAGVLGCKCHKSHYDMNGKVLSGPAPRALQTYETRLMEDKIVLRLPDDTAGGGA